MQGSYGVVKLAYNEDDNTYYVRVGKSQTFFLLGILNQEFDLSRYCFYVDRQPKQGV